MAVGLLLAMVDYGRSVIALIEAGAYKAIPGAARSTLDAYVDIVNLCERTDYWRRLELLDALQWKKILERASAKKNPYLAALSESPLLGIGRKLYKKQVREAEAAQATKPEIDDRFELAGLTHEYESAYALLSAEVHNNPSVVSSMHFHSDVEPPAIVEPSQRKERAQHYERSATMMLSESLLQATEKILRFLGHGVACLSEAYGEFERLKTRLGPDD